jgi:hypothetical protein
MFTVNPTMGVFSDVEGNWIMQSADDPTQLIPYSAVMPPDDSTLNRARFAFSLTELGQGTQVAVSTTPAKYWQWVVDDNGTNDGVLSLVYVPSLDYVGDNFNGKTLVEYWDSVLSPWPPG